MNWHVYQFLVVGKDALGYPFERIHEFAHASEEEARRETINVFNAWDLFPRKLDLLQVLEWKPLPFSFD